MTRLTVSIRIDKKTVNKFMEAFNVGNITIELQQILDAKGMSQRQLAELSGVRQERISQICRGYVDRIELEHVIKICDALQVTPSAWIIYDSQWMYDDSDVE